MEKKKEIIEILESYAFGKNSLKWVPEGGEILKSIGCEVAFVEFKRNSKDDPWTTETCLVFIESIHDYDPLTGTYEILYHHTGSENKETKKQRMIPEGFSFNVPERDNWMNRFIPMSLHFKLTEEDIYYQRLRTIYDTRPGFTMRKILELSKTDQSDTLGYHNYVSVIIDSDIPGGLGLGIIAFRIYRFDSIISLAKSWSFGLRDLDNNYFPLKIKTDQELTDGIIPEFKIDGQLIGNLKIMNIEDISEKIVSEENTKNDN